MGLFTNQPESNDEWAGLPSEPLRSETDAERLPTAPPADSVLFGAAESIVIPLAPAIEVAEEQGSSEPPLD